jgi:hypothetical protein
VLKYKLVTADGRDVLDKVLSMPPFLPGMEPVVLLWGNRAFVMDRGSPPGFDTDGSPDNPLVYREAFAWAAAASPELLAAG